MDSQGRPTILTEVLRNIICYSLGANEDQDLSVLLADLVQVLDELRTLFKITANFDDLLDVVVGRKFG